MWSVELRTHPFKDSKLILNCSYSGSNANRYLIINLIINNSLQIYKKCLHMRYNFVKNIFDWILLLDFRFWVSIRILTKRSQLNSFFNIRRDFTIEIWKETILQWNHSCVKRVTEVCLHNLLDIFRIKRKQLLTDNVIETWRFWKLSIRRWTSMGRTFCDRFNLEGFSLKIR